MKEQRTYAQYMYAVLGAACVLAVASCSTSRGYKQADITGKAINTLRNDIENIKAAVDESMKALDALAAAASTDPRKPYEQFSKSVDKVEKAQKTAQKDADEMRARGAEYFQEWQTQLAQVKNEDIRKMAEKNRAKLKETFDDIKKSAEDAKESFPVYLENLKDLRTALSSDLSVQGIDAAKSVFLKTKKQGAKVQEDLDEVITELNSVFAAITAAKAQPGATNAPAK